MDFQFRDEWVNELGSRWEGGIIQSIRGSNADFYELEIEGKTCMLRITAVDRRSIEAVQAELEWMRYMKSQDVLLNTPIMDRFGSWVQVKDWREKKFVACVTEKLEGEALGPTNNWNSEAISEWGRTMAHFHSATQGFQAQADRRSALNGELLLNLAQEVLPSNDPALKVLKRSWHSIANIPQVIDRYGLIHSDLTQANLRWANRQLSVFDFDDCQYAPFIYDLAITISVTFSNLRALDNFEAAVDFFLEHFLRGYYHHRHFDQRDLLVIQDILDYFNALVYVSYAHKSRLVSHAEQLESVRKGIEEGCFAELKLQDRIVEMAYLNYKE